MGVVRGMVKWLLYVTMCCSLLQSVVSLLEQVEKKTEAKETDPETQSKVLLHSIHAINLVHRLSHIRPLTTQESILVHAVKGQTRARGRAWE